MSRWNLPVGGVSASVPRPDGGRHVAVGVDAFDVPAIAYVERDGDRDEGSAAADPDERGDSGDSRPTQPCTVDGVNAAFEAAFGVGRMDAVGQSLLGVVSQCADGSDEATVREAVDAALAGDNPSFPPPSRTETRGGGDAETEMDDGGDAESGRTYVLTHARGDSSGLLLFTDVSERERERRDLEAANHRVSESVHAIAHDVRNPLEVAKIRLEAARETGEFSHLETAEGALDRIEQLIADLTVGMSDELQLEAETSVDPAKVAREAWSMVHTGEATLSVDDDIEAVRADPGHLQRLFENLFRNAVEHGRPDVAVRIRRTEGGFVVEDDGPGIPANERDRVFELGYTSTDDGTGLGLAIVERVATAHDWQVAVDQSELGGAAIRVTGLDESA